MLEFNEHFMEYFHCFENTLKNNFHFQINQLINQINQSKNDFQIERMFQGQFTSSKKDSMKVGLLFISVSCKMDPSLGSVNLWHCIASAISHKTFI